MRDRHDNGMERARGPRAVWAPAFWAALGLLCTSAASGQSDLERALETKGDRRETKAPSEGAIGLMSDSLGVTNLAGARLFKIPPEEPMAGLGDRMGPAPANDDCADAQLISGTGQFPFDNTNATMDGPAHFDCNFFGNDQIDRDVWFLWEAPLTTEYRLATCALAFFDTKMAIYSAGCPVSNQTLIACNDDGCGTQSQIIFSASAGEQILIRMGVFPGSSGGQGSFLLEVRPGQDICGQPAPNCQPANNAEAFDASAFFVFDDFRTTEAGSVSSVCFAGAFFDGIGDCQSQTAPLVTVAYYADIAGFPNSVPIAEFPLDGALTVNGPAPTGDLIDNQFPVYQFTASHDPVALDANTCYWIRITVDTQALGCNFFWRGATGGNTVSFQTTNAFPFPDDKINADLDFCLDIPLGDVTLCQSAQTPPNDDCASPEPLFSGLSTNFQNVFATDDPSDPEFSCRSGGAGQGSGSVWFSFEPDDSTARLSLCESTTGDTLMAVYEGSCGSLVEIACNDDACGVRSELRLTGLNPGQTYLVQIAGFNPIDQDFYRLRYDSPTPALPAEDVCSGAIELVVPPGGQDGTLASTEFATIDLLDAPACGRSSITSPGIWFMVQGTGEELTAALCTTDASFDTKMNVYCGASCSELVCIGTSDDDCDTQAQLTWCSEVGQTYYMMVWGFDGQIGVANLVITSSGQACATPPDCATCTVPCPPGARLEAEVCGEQLNDGCNLAPAAFEPIQCGDVICGNAAGVSNTRDTDWYEFTLSERSVVTCDVDVELPVEVFILGDTCSPPPTPFVSTIIDRCTSGRIEAILDPGTYRLFIANVIDGYPCGTSNVYVLRFECAPAGGCCESADCTSASAMQCAIQGGAFQGDGSACPITYQASPSQNAFEDISESGVPLVLDDDASELVSLPFSFKLFGVERSQIGISSNGFLSFVGAIDESSNAPIPTSVAPNGIVSGLWTDLDPAAQGMIYTQTLGANPDRRFIVQWSDVPRAIFGGSNTFQIVLFESIGCIELRYDVFDPEPAPGVYTVGVENFAGDSGTPIDAQTIANGDSILLCPIFDDQACAAPCLGDADASGFVNFADITSVLNNWLQNGPAGDANNDGVVNFADITSVLNNWLKVCP